MEKSGPRAAPRHAPLIIDRPDLQSWPQKAVSRALTTLFWLAWLALWLPLVTLAGWLAFGWQFHLHMFDLGGLNGLEERAGFYLAVVLATNGLLVLWAKYNHLRFRGVERRKPYPAVTDADRAAYTGLPEKAFVQWRGHRVMTVEHDLHGGIARIIPQTSPAAAAPAPGVRDDGAARTPGARTLVTAAA